MLEAGTYEWKLEGTKGFYETIDAIPLSNGVKFDEWADWGAGGTITYVGAYTIHTFLTSGTFEWTGDDVNISILVVAGGGGGGAGEATSGAGGGGAGGYRFNTTYPITIDSYTVTIGAGGPGGTGLGSRGEIGGNSSFGDYESIGGGSGGGSASNTGGSGGSSGGNSYANTGSTDPVLTPTQGNVGGSGAGNLANAGGGGGGGAGEVGESGFDGDGGEGGDGGDGTMNNINGTEVYFSGGGGAGGGTAGEGTGGLGGGGDGGTTTNDAGDDATANTGGGGGGGTGIGYDGGDGGSGIVIVRYLTVIGDTCTFNGTVQDESNTFITNATIYIISQVDHSLVNLSSNESGGWSYPGLLVGNYTIVGYDPLNISRDGDADPHVNCPEGEE